MCLIPVCFALTAELKAGAAWLVMGWLAACLPCPLTCQGIASAQLGYTRTNTKCGQFEVHFTCFQKELVNVTSASLV